MDIWNAIPWGCPQPALTNELRGLPMALLLLLLEEFVAGVGTGQEQSESLRDRVQGHPWLWGDKTPQRPSERHHSNPKSILGCEMPTEIPNPSLGCRMPMVIPNPAPDHGMSMGIPNLCMGHGMPTAIPNPAPGHGMSTGIPN